MGHLSLSLLGPLEIALAGESVAGFTSDKVRALLTYLAVEADRPHRRDFLAGLLWADWPDREARTNLRNALVDLRTAIGDRDAHPPFLLITRETIQFNTASDHWVDVTAFRKLVEANPPVPHDLEEAVDLYRGSFLEDFYLKDSPAFDDWSLLTRERLQRQALSALRRLGEYYEQRGEYERACEHAWRQLELEPWREEAHRQLMRLLALSGRRGGALAQYETCRRLLDEELGVEPAEETTELYEQIRDEELKRRAASSAPEAELPSFLREEHPRDVERPVFVARERELARLDEFLDLALAGQSRVAFVTGEAGSGKTALLQAFARSAQETHADLVVADGKCHAYSGVGDPYLPFREILELLTGDVEAKWEAGAISGEHARRLWHALPLAAEAVVDAGPDLIDTFVPGKDLVERALAYGCDGMDWMSRLDERVRGKESGPGAAGLRQIDLFQQVTQVLTSLARQRPLLLMVDDLQWADAGSISLLFHLARRVTGSRILIIGAYRPEEVALGRQGERHPLESVVNELRRRFGRITVNLDRAARRDFVEDLLDTEPNRLDVAFRAMLRRQTRGHPLFTIELLRGLQERGDLVRDREGRWIEGPELDWETLPARVEAVIGERVGRLDEALQAALRAASVEGETFTAEVVARVRRADEWELMTRLSDELERRHRLVRAQGIEWMDEQRLSRYRFRHILYQKYLYNSLDPVERAHLHEAVGDTLEALYEGRVKGIAGRLAWHYEEAGCAAKAIGYLHQVGDTAQGMYAHDEAIRAYQRALALLKEQGDHARAAQTLMKLGLTYHSAFRFDEARQAYEEGFALRRRSWEVEPAAARPTAPHALRVHGPVAGCLDPAISGWQANFLIISHIFSGLAELTPGGEVMPDVARRWEVLDGGRRYLFHLRDDVEWSDGVPVTAGDFEFALKRHVGRITGRMWYDIKGVRAFQQREVSTPEGVGVHALDDVTLAVELEGPTGHFLQVLPALRPVPRHVVERHGEAWTEVDNIVTNGPFRLEAWTPHESVTLVRNRRYHGRFAGNLERVELTWLAPRDGWGALEAYEADDLDLLRLRDIPSASERDRGRRDHAGEYVSAPESLTAYVGFCVTRPPFDDVRVRRAFVLATDRERYANVVLGGYVFPATGGFRPPGMPGHLAGIAPPHDPERARRLLDEAGYPGGRGFPALEMVCTGVGAGWQSEGSGLPTMWREILGVEISQQMLQTTDFDARCERESPDLFRLAWLPDYPDPDSFLRGCPGRTIAGWRNHRYEALVEQARRISDQEERMSLYSQAERILMEEAVLMPLYYGRVNLLVKPWVTKHPLSAAGLWGWKDFVIEPH